MEYMINKGGLVLIFLQLARLWIVIYNYNWVVSVNIILWWGAFMESLDKNEMAKKI